MNRRRFLAQAAGGAAGIGAGRLLLGPSGSARAAADALQLDAALATGVREVATLDALPGKVPLIKLSYRPPNYETPISYFDSPITPNDAFFVRYHLADIPTAIDAGTWRLKIGGEAATSPFALSLDELKRDFRATEVVAVCQCSGNRRGLFQPHVPGVQWGPGAMGNARWKGVRLKDVLERAGVKKDSVEVVFDGADKPIVDKTPDFIKSLPLSKALEEDVLIAYEMNGVPLPPLNGFPARLVVPGWTATYWVKHLTSIDIATKPFDGFWMKSAYRIPNGKFPVVQRFLGQETAANTPITEMVVNSLITSPLEGAKVARGKPLAVRGIAWDGGYGIQSLEVSADAGATWSMATLGSDQGRFSFRPWSFSFTPQGRAAMILMARATNRIGQTQTSELILNPAGYHHNLMHKVSVTVG